LMIESVFLTMRELQAYYFSARTISCYISLSFSSKATRFIHSVRQKRGKYYQCFFYFVVLPILFQQSTLGFFYVQQQ